MIKYIKLCILRERKVFGLVDPNWMIVHLLQFTLISWLLTLGPSTLTCVHFWLWWLLLYGVYLFNGLLKTIGPCIVMITLCFVKGPWTHLWFCTTYLILDLWTFTLWLYLNLLFYSFMILLIKTCEPLKSYSLMSWLLFGFIFYIMFLFWPLSNS